MQDLETGCEPSLIAMIKMMWSHVESVGDQARLFLFSYHILH